MVKDENSSGEKPLELFLKIGLDERTAKNTIANNKVTANLTAVIQEVLFPNILRFIESGSLFSPCLDSEKTKER